MGGGDAEEGSERGVPGAATVEAEDELVEIGLKVFAAQAVVDAQGPDLEVGENPVTILMPCLQRSRDAGERHFEGPGIPRPQRLDG